MGRGSARCRAGGRAQPKLAAGALVLLGLAAAGGWPRPCPAQGRFEDVSAAEQVFQQGLLYEEEAAALQRREGVTAKAQPLYEKALEQYERAIRLEPRAMKAYAKAGYVLYVLDRPAEAIELLEQAMKLDEQNLDVQHILGINYFKHRDHDRALPLLRKVVTENPDLYYSAAFILGKYYYDRNDHQNAADYFKKYLKVKPDDHKVHGALGNIYLKQKRFAEALEEFDRVLKLNPDDLPAAINVGNIQYQQGNFPDAARRFEQILQRERTKPSIHYNLASSYFQLHRHADAVRLYRSFLALQPDSLDGHFYLAQALAAQGELAEAAREFEQTRRIQPGHPGATYRLGLVLAQLGQWDRAKTLLEQAAGSKPDDPWPRAQLGNVLRLQGALDAAWSIHREVVGQHPANPHFQVYLGETLVALGKLDEAEARFTAALKLAPGLAAAREGRAALLCRRARQAMADGRADAARALLEEALALAPGDVTASRGLALLQARQGEPGAQEEALARLTRLAAQARSSSPLPGDELARAELLALRGRVEQAEQVLGRAGSAAGSGEPRRQHALALLLAARGDLDAALALLEPLVRQGQPAGEVLRNLARLQARRAAALLGEGKAVRARSLLLEAEKLAAALPPAQSWQIRMLLVRALLDQRDHARAVEAIRPLRRLQPASSELDYLEAYAQYRLAQYDKAWGLLHDHPELRRPGRVAELARQVLQRQAAASLRRGQARPALKLLHRARALPGGDSDAIRHDAALADWLGGNKAAAQAALTGLARRGNVPEAELNLGLIHDQRGERQRAYELYRAYAARGGEHAGLARQLAEIKERIFGFGGGGGTKP